MTADWDVERWIDDDEREAIEYADYWNDAAAERAKPFDVEAHGFQAMERYLAETGLPTDLRACLQHVRETGVPLGRRGADVAAGTLWAVPVLLAEVGVEHVCCVEYSRHRLLDLGPKVLEHYGVAPERVTLALGSFYELKLADDSLDFAFLSQAFHHADDPAALLRELSRVLADGGRVLIIGEHRVTARTYGAYAARSLLGLLPSGVQQRMFGRTFAAHLHLRPSGSDLEPPDPVLGDHVYTTREYDELFKGHGFDWTSVALQGGEFRGFVLTKTARGNPERV